MGKNKTLIELPQNDSGRQRFGIDNAGHYENGFKHFGNVKWCIGILYAMKWRGREREKERDRFTEKKTKRKNEWKIIGDRSGRPLYKRERERERIGNPSLFGRVSLMVWTFFFIRSHHSLPWLKSHTTTKTIPGEWWLPGWRWWWQDTKR